jgi:hypothetical protein
MENQFQLKITHAGSTIDGDSIVGEYSFHQGGEDYEIIEASPITTTATIYENDDKLFMKFDFIYSPLNINSEIKFGLDDLIIGDLVSVCNGLFELYSYGNIFIFNKYLIIRFLVKRTIYENGNRVDLFEYFINGTIDNELKSKLPDNRIIYKYVSDN